MFKVFFLLVRTVTDVKTQTFSEDFAKFVRFFLLLITQCHHTYFRLFFMGGRNTRWQLFAKAFVTSPSHLVCQKLPCKIQLFIPEVMGDMTR